jgi:hypothetical protein
MILMALHSALAQPLPPVEDFPIAQLEYKARTNLVYLHSSYGFVVKWGEAGTPRFYLYDKPRTNIVVTTNLEAFLTGLSKFPDAAEVAWVNTCCCPLHWGMPKETEARIQDVLKRKKFKMAGIEENNYVVCTCESKRLVFFANAAPVLAQSGLPPGGVGGGRAVTAGTNLPSSGKVRGR